jgi:hypothetical protein
MTAHVPTENSGECATCFEAWPCAAALTAEGPANVTLTDDELEPLRVALMVAYASQPMGYDRAKRATDRTVAEVVAPFAARVDALTADLAAARSDAFLWRTNAAEAERVIANVRALADEWRYKGEFGWGPWQTGEGPDHEGEVLDRASTALRALLPAAPTGEDS